MQRYADENFRLPVVDELRRLFWKHMEPAERKEMAILPMVRQAMRKAKLTQVERDILWLLEEAGEENLPCIRATLKCTEDELSRAVAGLMRIGFISDSIGTGLPAIYLTELGRAGLTK